MRNCAPNAIVLGDIDLIIIYASPRGYCTIQYLIRKLRNSSENREEVSTVGRVFISWSGDSGRRIAELLQKTLLKYPGAEAWVSSRDVQSGSPWLNEVTAALKTAEHAIACLTPGTFSAPWINFEAGFVFGRLGRMHVLTIGEDLPANHPLRTLQTLDGLKINDLKTLLVTLTENEDFSEKWLSSLFPAWKKSCEAILGNAPELLVISSALQAVQNAARKLEGDIAIFANPAFRSVVKQSLDEIRNQLDGVFTTYVVPADRYPAYLATLQRESPTTVLAVALVEKEEHFWRGQMGKKILDTIRGRDNERIFVLQSARHCYDFLPILLEHARKYQVYVLPQSVLAMEQAQYARDFSLIEVAGQKVVATYVDQGMYFRNIQFSTDLDVVREHEAAFAAIRDLSTSMTDRNYTEDDIIEIWTRAERSLSELERRTVEMSAYIQSIPDYDAHEEKHAYFREMLEKMIDLLPLAGKSPLRILEMGAGTGILTKRLAALPSVGEVFAIEYDWACYHHLRDNMRRFQGKVITEYKDSRTFDPPGKFDVIVSSFADHHIRPGDKRRYFENVIRNLKTGALYIVGDEFLREHDPANETERVAALHAWHDHVIELAEKDNERILAELERESLISGIERKGDFKLPCSIYESMLRKAGFAFEKFLIGPQDISDIGGIYVYRASLVRN